MLGPKLGLGERTTPQLNSPVAAPRDGETHKSGTEVKNGEFRKVQKVMASSVHFSSAQGRKPFWEWQVIFVYLSFYQEKDVTWGRRESIAQDGW